MPSTATSVDLVHDTPPKMSIASSAPAGVAQTPSVANRRVGMAHRALLLMPGIVPEPSAGVPRLYRDHSAAPEARQERRAGGAGGHEYERRRAEPGHQAHEREDDAAERHRLDRRLLERERHAFPEPSRRDRESEEQQGDEQQGRDGDEWDTDDRHGQQHAEGHESEDDGEPAERGEPGPIDEVRLDAGQGARSEEHTSELQS